MASLISHMRPALAQTCRNGASRTGLTRCMPIVRNYVGGDKPQASQPEPKESQQLPSRAIARHQSHVTLPGVFGQMQRELDTLSRAFFGDDSLMAPFGTTLARSAWRDKETWLCLATDIYEDEKAFMVKVDCPGMSKEDIKIRLKDGVLVISGERKEQKLEGEGESAWVERSFGSFRRAFKLGMGVVDEERVTASCDNGVLTVTLPKKEVQAPQPKEIPVA